MLPRMRDLFTLSCGVRAGWLRDILRERRMAVHFQPIVFVADPGEVFTYECLLRGAGKDGEMVSPRPMFGSPKRSRPKSSGAGWPTTAPNTPTRATSSPDRPARPGPGLRLRLNAERVDTRPKPG